MIRTAIQLLFLIGITVSLPSCHQEFKRRNNQGLEGPDQAQKLWFY